MPNYTIAPNFLKFAKDNLSYIYDVLMVFVPDNSNKICLDFDESIFDEYDQFIRQSKDLSDWLNMLSKRKDLSFIRINSDKSIDNLSLGICKESYDRLLITEVEEDFKNYREFIDENQINLLNKDIAKLHLNYSSYRKGCVQNNNYTEINNENIREVIENICLEFLRLVEYNGIHKLIYNGIKRVPEKELQLLFFAVAFSYCQAGDLKLCPEVNSGNGPVDFNFSKGMKANVNVELKFADNPKLDNGLWYQLKAYNLAERTENSIYLVIYTNKDELPKITQLENILQYRKLQEKIVPVLIKVDATEKVSASNRVA